MKTPRMRRVTARYTWDRMKVSFWFAPAVMSLGAILLAWVIYWIDGLIPNELLEDSRFFLSGTPEEIRSMLLTQATTILTTAGIVFTLLTLPLSTVAAQYGSRLLRIFLADRITQFVLGTFVATFTYCLAAILTIPPAEVNPEGPQLTATIGLLLLIATFASLILLIHHISTSLQAPHIAAAAGAQLQEVVIAEIPDAVAGSAGPATALNSLVEENAYPVRVTRAGYIQYIDPHYILALAQEKDLVIRLLRKPGHFVWSDARVALVWPAGRVDKELDQEIRKSFRIGSGRTPTQDVAYAVNQLVEMAVRAMSPAINDPFTAITCLDHIGNGLARFIQQGHKSPYYYDQDHRLRLVLEPVTFPELLDSAFDMLRHASCDNASVLLQMLDVIGTISQQTGLSVEKTGATGAGAGETGLDAGEVRRELLRHVNLIQAESKAGALIDPDREQINQRCAQLSEQLGFTAS